MDNDDFVFSFLSHEREYPVFFVVVQHFKRASGDSVSKRNAVVFQIDELVVERAPDRCITPVDGVFFKKTEAFVQAGFLPRIDEGHARYGKY